MLASSSKSSILSKTALSAVLIIPYPSSKGFPFLSSLLLSPQEVISFSAPASLSQSLAQSPWESTSLATA